jgi:hypothetical protein
MKTAKMSMPNLIASLEVTVVYLAAVKNTRGGAIAEIDYSNSF